MVRSLFPRRGLHVDQVKGADSFALCVAMIAEHHRHHDPPVGWMWGLMAWRDGWLVGVATVGRPVSRNLQAQGLLEVTRLCTFSRRRFGAASAMYRAVHSLCESSSGVITYTLGSESGESLIKAGWHDEGPAGGGSWSAPSRPRVDHHPTERKTRWRDRPA